MKKRVFIDTDVILDVALARKEFLKESRLVLVMAENGMYEAFTSALVISNLYYILRKAGGDEGARKFIRTIIKYLRILSADQTDIENALDSNFADFEDAIQNSISLRNHCEIIVTRNVADYKKPQILILQPIELVKMYKEKL